MYVCNKSVLHYVFWMTLMDAVHLVKINNTAISVFDSPTNQIHLLNFSIFTKQLQNGNGKTEDVFYLNDKRTYAYHKKTCKKEDKYFSY